LLDEARQLQEVVRRNSARDRLETNVRRSDQDVLQDHVTDLDRDIRPLLKDIGKLDLDSAPQVKRVVERIDYAEQQLYTALTRGLAKEIPVDRLIRLLDEEAEAFRRAAEVAAQGDMDTRRLADDAKLFAAEADHFRSTLDRGYTRVPARADFDRVSATWSVVQRDLRLIPRTGNETLFNRAGRVSDLYDRLARQMGVTR
jgi:hypothetical protein